MRLAGLAVLLLVGACPGRAERTAEPTTAPPATSSEAAPPDATLADAEAFYAKQPRYLRPLPHSETPTGLANTRSETCGACHAAIYDEWATSTHAHAWTDDAQFMAELGKSKKQGVDWMCVNCHTPVLTQLEQVVVGLEGGAKDKPIRIPNPLFDPEMQDDAIGCATCHVRDGVVLGPWGDTNAPHPVRKAEELLTTEVCTQCHQAAAHFPEITLLCAFDTGNEYEAGPYDDEGKTCQSCHMPSVQRPLMAGMPERATRRHWFGGSLIPKAPQYSEEIAGWGDAYPHGLTLAWGSGEAPTVQAGIQTLTATYTNAEAGHRLPTGDPERWLLVEAWVEDSSGAVLGRAEERIASVYQWWPTIEKLSDNRLAPRESRHLQVEIDAPAGGELTLRLRATKGRLSDEVMEYHRLEGKAVASIVFVDKTAKVTVQ